LEGWLSHTSFFLFKDPSMHIEQQQKLRLKLREALNPIAEENKLYISGIEFSSDYRGPLVRVYIDGVQGVTIGQCAQLSKEFSMHLDVEDPISTAYTLEVSSPGLDRLLELSQDFERFNNFHIRIKRLNQKSKIDGILLSHDNDGINIRTAINERFLPFDDIVMIRLHPTDEEIQRLIESGDQQ